MKTRRFTALEKIAGEARLVDKVAVYDDKGCKIDCCEVQVDTDGRVYYFPSNLKDQDGLFIDKIKDAVECIRNGFGDTITQINLTGIICVVRYFDRIYGEKLRSKTIEQYKNSQFRYGVKLSYNNSIRPGRLVLKDYTLSYPGYACDEILTFETEKEASEFAEVVYARVKAYVKDYKRLDSEMTGDEDYDYNNIVSPFLKEVAYQCGGHLSVYYEVFVAELLSHTKDGCEYELKIVQVAI